MSAERAGRLSIGRAARVLRDVSRFGRFSVLGFSLLVPLLGAGIVSTPSAGAIAGLIATAVAFHLFAYVSNDVFDLAIDRTQPLRTGSPLVRGLVRPSTALAIALVPVPAASIAHVWVGGPPAAAIALLAGMGLGLIYNAWGKRIPVPPLSDAVQALAWIALMLYGALAARRPLPSTVVWLGAAIFVYVLLINGVHGGLRDLDNDARHGARTTALYLGASATSDGRLFVPFRLAMYALALEIALFFLTALGVIVNASSLVWLTWPVIVAALVPAHFGLFRLSRAALRPDAGRAEVLHAGSAHLFLSMGIVFLPFACFADRLPAFAIVAAYAIPFLILLPYLGLISMTRRVTARAAVFAIALVASASIGLTAARAEAQEEAGQARARVVTRQEIADAMRREKGKGYDILATPNGARFAAGVILDVARRASELDPLRTPLVLDYRDYFEAFVGVAGVGRENAPPYIRVAFDHREDQYVDYRPQNVIVRVVKGPSPRFAVNVVTGWTGPPARYSYEDHGSEPPLRVTRQRMTAYRLVDFGDALLFDEIDGISGRALGGLLGLLFRFIGDGNAVRSFIAVAGDGIQVTRTTGRKGPVVLTTTATVDLAGRGEKGLPPSRPDLEAIEERLQRPFEAEYAPVRKADAFRWQRVTRPSPP